MGLGAIIFLFLPSAVLYCTERIVEAYLWILRSLEFVREMLLPS